jgi:hypothetical protein
MSIVVTVIEARGTVVRKEEPDVEVVEVLRISDEMQEENVNLLVDDVQLVTRMVNRTTRETGGKLRFDLVVVAEKPERRP